jgi:hypothetical protein
MRCPPLLAFASTMVLLACSEPTAAEHLALTVTLDRTTLVPPNDLQIRIRVVNPTRQRVQFSGSGSGTLWADIRTASGASAVQRPITDDLRFWTLEPGDSLVVIQHWNGRANAIGPYAAVAPGSYTVVARLTAREVRRISAPVSLTVAAAAP